MLLQVVLLLLQQRLSISIIPLIRKRQAMILPKDVRVIVAIRAIHLVWHIAKVRVQWRVLVVMPVMASAKLGVHQVIDINDL